MHSTIRKILITEKILLAILSAFVLFVFYKTSYIIYREKIHQPTHLNEKPQLLYEIYGNELDNPMGVIIDARGNLYVSDPGSHQIKVFENTGKTIGSFGKPGTGKGQLNYPYGLAIDNSGKLLVADPANRRVSVYNRTGKYIKDLVPPDNHLGLVRPGTITVDGKLIYISDLWGHQVVVIDDQGKLVRRIGSPGSEDGKLKFPQSVVVDKQHRVWVADTGNNRIQVFDGKGKFLFSISGQSNQLNLSLLRGMATDNLQRVLVADAVSSKILVFDSKGKKLFSFGGLGSKDEQFRYPMSLWIGRDGRIYIADRGNHRVQVWGYKGR